MQTSIYKWSRHYLSLSPHWKRLIEYQRTNQQISSFLPSKGSNKCGSLSHQEVQRILSQNRRLFVAYHMFEQIASQKGEVKIDCSMLTQQIEDFLQCNTQDLITEQTNCSTQLKISLSEQIDYFGNFASKVSELLTKNLKSKRCVQDSGAVQFFKHLRNRKRNKPYLIFELEKRILLKMFFQKHLSTLLSTNNESSRVHYLEQSVNLHNFIFEEIKQDPQEKNDWLAAFEELDEIYSQFETNQSKRSFVSLDVFQLQLCEFSLKKKIQQQMDANTQIIPKSLHFFRQSPLIAKTFSHFKLECQPDNLYLSSLDQLERNVNNAILSSSHNISAVVERITLQKQSFDSKLVPFSRTLVIWLGNQTLNNNYTQEKLRNQKMLQMIQEALKSCKNQKNQQQTKSFLTFRELIWFQFFLNTIERSGVLEYAEKLMLLKIKRDLQKIFPEYLHRQFQGRGLSPQDSITNAIDNLSNFILNSMARSDLIHVQLLCSKSFGSSLEKCLQKIVTKDSWILLIEKFQIHTLNEIICELKRLNQVSGQVEQNRGENKAKVESIGDLFDSQEVNSNEIHRRLLTKDDLKLIDQIQHKLQKNL